MRSLRSWMHETEALFHRGFRMEPLGGANSIWKLSCLCAISDGVPRRSLYVALVFHQLVEARLDLLRALRGVHLRRSLVSVEEGERNA
jgi:hypothetical protein